MRAFFSAAALLALVASGAAQARPYPNRAAIEAALNAYEACRSMHNQACYPPLSYRLTRSRCESLGRFNYDQARIICFTGARSTAGARSPGSATIAPISVRPDAAAGAWTPIRTPTCANEEGPASPALD